jgi:hypothetical protein
MAWAGLRSFRDEPAELPAKTLHLPKIHNGSMHHQRHQDQSNLTKCY